MADNSKFLHFLTTCCQKKPAKRVGIQEASQRAKHQFRGSILETFLALKPSGIYKKSLLQPEWIGDQFGGIRLRYLVKVKMVLLLMFGGIIFYAAIAGSGDDVENKGAEIILISGGEKMRDVHFPHHRHQNALGDCNICHDLFPKKLGSIEELKNQGKLKKKQVMQDHCIDCHKEMKAADRKTGPTSCARCHRKTGY